MYGLSDTHPQPFNAGPFLHKQARTSPLHRTAAAATVEITVAPGDGVTLTPRGSTACCRSRKASHNFVLALRAARLEVSTSST